MDVVFEGALSRSWGMPDVLRAVMGIDNQPFGVLRISSSSARISGRLAIADGAYIVGAVAGDVLNPQEVDTGYLAVRKLLTANEGNFAFLDTSGVRPSDADGTLYLSLELIISSWPHIPPEASGLFDEKSLLDKVFGPAAQLSHDSAVEADIPGTLQLASGEIIPDKAQPNYRQQDLRDDGESTEFMHKPGDIKDSGRKEFEDATFTPMIADAASAPANPHYSLTKVAEDPHDNESQKREASRLRHSGKQVRSAKTTSCSELFRKPPFCITSLIWIGAILILLLVATLFGTAAVNWHN